MDKISTIKNLAETLNYKLVERFPLSVAFYLSSACCVGLVGNGINAALGNASGIDVFLFYAGSWLVFPTMAMTYDIIKIVSSKSKTQQLENQL